MASQFGPYILVLLVSGSFATALGVYAYARPSPHQSRTLLGWFIVIAASAATWSFGYALQLAGVSLQWKLFWHHVVWLGALGILLSWPVFVLAFTGRTRWASKQRWPVLAIVPVGLFVAFATNGLHALFYADVELSMTGALATLSIRPGPLLVLYLGYAYAITLMTFVLLLHRAIDVRGAHRRQTLLLLLAGLLPMIAGFLFLTGRSPIEPTVDPTPMLFSLTSGIVGVALFRYGLLDSQPIVRDTIVENLEEAIIVVDLSHRIVDLNPAARDVLERTQSSVDPIGERLDSIIDLGPGTVESARSHLSDLVIGRGDERRFYELETSTLPGTTVEIGGHVVVLRDVTDHRAEERLFRALIENATDVTLLLERDATVRYATPSAVNVLGYEPAALEGTKITRFIHPDDRDRVVSEFTEDETADRIHAEFRVRHADGTYRTLDTFVRDLQADPDVDGHVVTARDVTERRGYEQRLQVMNRVLRHDIRNDVNVILGYTERLRTELHDESPLRELSIIESRAKRLLALSEKARHVSTTLDIDTEQRATLELTSFLERKIRSLRDAHPHVEFDLDVSGEQAIYSHRLATQAIENVIENAIEHNDRPRPEVTISVSLQTIGDAEYVDVRIADDGPGIPPEERRVLTEGRETALEHTSGVGLWLIHWLVHRGDGDVLISENDPRGSVVTLRIPRLERDAPLDGRVGHDHDARSTTE